MRDPLVRPAVRDATVLGTDTRQNAHQLYPQSHAASPEGVRIPPHFRPAGTFRAWPDVHPNLRQPV